ncbi:MAG: LLM class flavin-dependent oxidoreductase [Candidatus Thorarchaeota archaeon]
MSKMSFGLYVPNFGKVFGYARTLGELAKVAEDSGWDGFFVWDHIQQDRTKPLPMVDPWVGLSAMAVSTNRIRIGTTVTPLPRRRPWKLARETVSLDHLSQGRLTLGLGLGYPPEEEFDVFGEVSDVKTWSRMLDEGIEILVGLWSGKPFSYSGQYYRIDNARFSPKPLQSPRIPIWIAGTWPNKKPFLRASSMDGIFPLSAGFRRRLTPDDFKDILQLIEKSRTIKTPFDVVAMGMTSGQKPAKMREIVTEYKKVGATWWLELILSSVKTDDVRRRISAGPPEL